MSRRTRWTNIVHSFRAGVLSPAAQDQIDSEAWLQGAARLDNFLVERDGGVTGRPAFVRSEIEPPQPRYGLIAGPWSVDAGTDAGPAPAMGSGTRNGTFDAGYYAADGDGVARFPSNLAIESYGADTTKDLLRVDLLSGMARAITFHSVVIRQGSWRGQDAGFDRLNLRVVGRKRSDQSEVRFDAPPGPSVNEEPLALVTGQPAFGKFAPGLVARDIVVRLIPNGEQAPVDLDRIMLRYARAGAATSTQAFQLSVGGVSCFADVGGSAAVELPPSVLNAPFRIIPWVIRDQTFALVLGMDWVSVFVIGEDGQIERRLGDDANSRGVWHFTARQLRELTWAAYGGNLLLFHQDFPWPLEVHLPLGGRRFGISPLRLRNIAELSQAAQGRIAPEITSAGDVFQVAAGVTRIPQVVTYGATGFPRGIRVAWAPTDADAYKVYWTTKTNYDQETIGGIEWNAQASTTASERTVSAALRTFDIANLTASTQYAVAVVSLIGASESAVGMVVIATALHNRLGAPVISASPHATTNGRIDLDWADVALADRYVVQWRSGSESYSATRQRIVSASEFNGTFTAGTTYTFRVLARSSTGAAQDSPWSAEAIQRAYNTTPGAPTGLTAATATLYPNAVNLSWMGGANADGVNIQYRESGQTSTTDVPVSGTDTTRRIDDLTGGTSYQFRIQSTRTNARPSAWTAWSTAVAASASTIVPPLPSPPRPTTWSSSTRSLDGGRYRVNWFGGGGTTEMYEVRWAITRSEPGSHVNDPRVGALAIGSFTFPVSQFTRGFGYETGVLHGPIVTDANGNSHTLTGSEYMSFQARSLRARALPSAWGRWSSQDARAVGVSL